MIICAAIDVTFTNANGKTIQTIISGHRHANCWELMHVLELPPKSKRKEIEGFLDHKGAFLNRRDAFKHALECGQLSDTVLTYKQEKMERELYSEDLY
ncbi:MAG: hypothetical protein IKB86_07090 [Clostridia bacterium]|nr:hypothetical protein [Clostridia bacterium]